MQMLDLFNAERRDRGLGTLGLDSTLLSQIDLNHSREMAQYNYFGHPSPINNPGTDSTHIFARDTDNPAIAGHYSYLGENIAAGYSTAAAAVYAYMYQDASSCWGHRHNILGYQGSEPTCNSFTVSSVGNFNWVGIGVASGGSYGVYYSSDFMQSSNYVAPSPADTQAPALTPPTVVSGTAGGTVTAQTTNVQDTGAASGAAGITGVVFYVNSISVSSSGTANTVEATQSSTSPSTWTATFSLPVGATVHAVAVDGSGNFTDCAATASSCGSTSTNPPPSGSAAVSLSVASGIPGSMVTASGSGFAASDSIKLYWDSASTTPIATTTASTSGTFTRGFVVPQSVNGSHTLIAVGSSTKTASAPFKVLAKMTLSRASGTPGIAITVMASGFGSGEAIAVHWGSATGPQVGTGTAGSIGSANITFTVPQTVGGATRVYAVGTTSGSPSAPFTVMPSLKLSPTSGVRGSAVTVSGAGYRSGETVTIKWNCSYSSCAGSYLATASTTNGSFSATTIHIPYSALVGYSTMVGGVGSLGSFAGASYYVTG